ncbi:MAG TPA: topoisomerase C-terminal repeat-containing protein, partial [Kofleriaceae bacterium]|nr:topoisomerase C-terminal repeat-containing protein [Kofleriaceae bacterium]
SQAPGTAPAARPQRAAKPRAAKPPAVATADLGSLTCPRCRRGALITGSRGWGCARWREGCRFVVWFETAGKRLTAAQLRTLVTTGKTRKATFVDASGREVTARLVLDPARDGGARLEPV